MGAGKTSVGKALSALLARDFVDLDGFIVSSNGKTIPQIFSSAGEQGFRILEQEALTHVLTSNANAVVIALGGGTFVEQESFAALNEAGATTVFLCASPEELYRRCVDSLDAPDRPLLKDLPTFKKLYLARLPFYQRAQWHVETSGRPVPEIAAEIASLLGLLPSGKNRMNP